MHLYNIALCLDVLELLIRIPVKFSLCLGFCVVGQRQQYIHFNVWIWLKVSSTKSKNKNFDIGIEFRDFP